MTGNLSRSAKRYGRPRGVMTARHYPSWATRTARRLDLSPHPRDCPARNSRSTGSS
jgi:hypothetical protein